MSKTPNPTRTGGKNQLPSEASPDPTPRPESSKLSSSLLTVENVRKHQEENPVARSDLAQWSIEAYIADSNRFLNESGSQVEGSSREQAASNEEESRVLRDGYPENANQTLGKDFQTRPMSAPVPETQSPTKREVADLETQTEWSYSVSSEDSSVLEIETKEQRSTDGKKKSETTEAETLHPAEEEGTSESELETESTSEEEEEEMKSFILDEDHPATDLCLVGRCEFCNALLKPLPNLEELAGKAEEMEQFLCCRTYKEVFQYVVQELMQRRGSEIDIRPHGRLSLTNMESRIKRMLTDGLEERGIEQYREIFMQYIHLAPRTKIHFELSEHPPKAPVRKKPLPGPKELLEVDLEFRAEQLKLLLNYPSGRLAILITYLRETQFTYSILGDSRYQELLAFFTNQGHAAHDQQRLRLHLDVCNGSLFGKRGQRQKFWNWWGPEGHVHAPPFQPIYLQLNVYIQVKIKAQDQILLTFAKVHDCLHLNVGARLKLKEAGSLWVLQRHGTRDHLVRPSVLEKISKILSNVKTVLKKLDADPSKEAADLRLVSKAYGRMLRRHSKK